MGQDENGVEKHVESSSIKGDSPGEIKHHVYREHLWDISRLQKELNTSFDEEDPTKSSGLSENEVEIRLARDGPNRLSPPPTKTFLQRVASAVNNPFMIPLFGSGILCLCAFIADSNDKVNLYLAVAMFFIVALSVTFTVYQEVQASDIMSGFMNLLPPTVLVRRDGETCNIECTGLVVGDVIVINTGDKIPADIRLLHVSQLKIDNSSLTGESVPVSMQVNPDHDEFLEAKNIAFSGTLVTSGLGCGVVIRTGDHSYVGSIARLASDSTVKKSTMTKEVDDFVRFIAILSIAMGVSLSIYTLIREGLSFETIVHTLVSVFAVIVVANVPQGLPSAVAGAFAVAAKKLSRKNVFVKSLNLIETLGSVSVIASDKTGTLTQNKMSVTSVWCDGSIRSANKPFIEEISNEATPVDPGAIVDHLKFNSGFEVFVLLSAICNTATKLKHIDHNTGASHISILLDEPHKEADDTKRKTAQFDQVQEKSVPQSPRSFVAANENYQDTRTSMNEWMSVLQRQPVLSPDQFSGNASDIALYQFAERHLDVIEIRKHWVTVFQVPFSSHRKWMLSVHRSPSSMVARAHIVMIKGAPERILHRCDKIQIGSRTEAISESHRKEFMNVNNGYMKRGRRVLAMAFSTIEIPQGVVDVHGVEAFFEKEFASGKLIGDPDSPESVAAMTLIGSAALEDPPKDTVPSAILKCRSAGIRVVMVTGDHPATASSIAAQCNILGSFKTREEVQAAEGVESVDEKQIGAIVVTGHELNSFTDADWDRVLSKPEIVFARTSPLDKLTIVQQFQKRGEVVAVTGDGVNDSPALKKADVGIAMGLRGSEVAKEAGSMILMDDEFLSIVVGIEEGRIIFDNIINVVAYNLSHLTPALCAIVLALLFESPFGMTSLMILVIDLITEMPPSLALAYESAEENIMDRPPRTIKVDRLVSKQMMVYVYVIAGGIETLACFGAWIGVFLHYDVRLSDVFFSNYFRDDSSVLITSKGNEISVKRQEEIVTIAQSAFFCTLVFSQFWHVWMCKTRFVSIRVHGLFGNNKLNVAVMITLFIMFISVFLPGLNEAIGAKAETSVAWLFIVPSLFSLIILWVYNEGRKYAIRCYPDASFTKYVLI